MPLQISDRVRALGAQAQDALSEQFARIDAIAEYNTQKVLSAFQTHKVAESMFQGTTGYGYDDLGRETLGAIYADLFGAEDAMVRINFVNGTHAISSALYGVLRPGMCWSPPLVPLMIPCKASLGSLEMATVLSKNSGSPTARWI